ncbi:hypothetical protein Bhyg_15217, partial [Pseudolycoriella hygida]
SENVYGITRANPTSAALTVNNEISPVTVQPSKDLKSGESRLFNDPLPEYYKGPMSSAELEREKNRDRYGLSRPDQVEHRDSGSGFVTSYGTSATFGSNRYTPATGYGNRERDRISVGHYGSGSSYYGGSSGYGYDNPRGAYGPPQVVDYPHWGTNGGYGDGVYGVGGYDGINIGGKHIPKSHLIPLAGAALLGLAAILVANPMLLQLGVVSGKRKRR